MLKRICLGFASLIFYFTLEVSPVFAESQDQAVSSPLNNVRLQIHGLVVTSLSGESSDQSININMMRLKIRADKDEYSLNAEVDPSLTNQVLAANVAYTLGWRMKVQIGRIHTPTLSMLFVPSVIPYKNARFTFHEIVVPSIAVPLAGIRPPFYDNGISAGGAIGPLYYKLAVMNGSGEYRDNNTTMDYAVQTAYMAESGNIRFTFQRGNQPAGMRSIYAADLYLTPRPALIRAGIMHRPELDAIGYYGELTIAQNGKVEYSLLGEETEIKSRSPDYRRRNELLGER